MATFARHVAVRIIHCEVLRTLLLNKAHFAGRPRNRLSHYPWWAKVEGNPT